MSTRDFLWGKGGRCIWLTTYHHRSAERQENLGLNLPGTLWPTSACCGMTFTFTLLLLVSFHSGIMSEQSGCNVQWNFDIRVSMEHYTIKYLIIRRLRYGKRISRCENLRFTIENLVGIPLLKLYSFKKQLILQYNSIFSLDI